jgi:carboxypeptidase family protein/TonB-dependent receptor-like protein
MPFIRLRESGLFIIFTLAGALVFSILQAAAQSNSGLVQGTVTDPSNAAVPGATVRLENPVSGYMNQTMTDTNGSFRIPNIPFNPYHLTVTAQGFATLATDVDVRSTVPITVQLALKLGSSTTNITVTESAADLIEEDSNFHTDVDRGLFDKLPLESQSSSLSSLITLSSPGVFADSNGLFHGLGDHAENSFSVDGQPITDQQSKVFSNQIPTDSIQSIEVIAGAPPAEFGDKTSLVIKATTRSGLGQTQTHGSVTGSYGSFGTTDAAFNVAFGGPKWGNFIAANGLNTSRFLDPPEFHVFHAKGNEENVFDRVDFKVSGADTIQLNLNYTRSWFQSPNSIDAFQSGVRDPFGNPLPPTDQHAEIKTFNIAPSWSHLIGTSAVFTLGAFVRRDQFLYFPSADPFSDRIPNEQSETISQNRILTNAGLRSDLSYVKGVHNLKAGVTYQHTLLTENFSLGIVDPGLVPSLVDVNGNPCLDVNGNPIASPCTDLASHDLTTGGTPFLYHSHADIKELALYVQDTITKGNWSFNLGVRGDIYRGFVNHSEPEPRLGIAYNIKPTNTVLRISYGRTLETPFNENLIIASTGCQNAFLSAFSGVAFGTPCAPAPLGPGWRNEFHAGLQQAFGKYFVLDGDYMWKYTHNAYDFSDLGNTPIFFPIAWAKSKIPGFSVRATVPNFHRFTAFVVLSSVAARFFGPQVAGLGSGIPSTSVFRIDHDERLAETTHIQYQPFTRGPWFGFNWRYDSGLVAGRVPCAGGESCHNGPAGSDTIVDTSAFTPDQQFEGGLFCGSVHATPTTPITSALGANLCPAAQYGSTLIQIPAPGTENDDHNPPRILPRHLFDVSIGDDDVLHFHTERYKVSLRLTVINLTNKVALYNFFSTFSGTHYITPRTATVELGFHF